MSQPIYDIPVTPPGKTGDNWVASSGEPAVSIPTPPSPTGPAFTAQAVDERRRRTANLSENINPADLDLLDALAQVIGLGASDLHITVGAPPIIRLDGSLRPVDGTTPWMEDKVAAALQSILTPDQQETFERELELDFAFSVGMARFRVNYYQQRGWIAGSFRLIPREIKSLEALGVPASVRRFAGLPRGLVLVTGPTGSGKSTTLAALVDLANRTRADHIVTVEDPIEFLHQHRKSIVDQREVGRDTHSFAAALKHVLRQDPDIILIGELRDLETISVALTAAETGHLVFATLHTQSAAQTIDRVIDAFPPFQQAQVRAQLAATLEGVVCQTLVKKPGGGRVVATEVLIATSAIANLIREGKTYQIGSTMQAGRAQGMHTMDQHLASLVSTGAITRESAEEIAQDPITLGQLISRADATDSIVRRDIDFGDSFSSRII
jgi:twitching motility protein PilT